jgi:hypothetical protein
MKINMKKILLSVFVLSILLPTLAFASFDTSLKYGSRGDAVIELQDLLIAQGFLKGNSDGRYGLVTLNAVKAFQTANGLSSDGYFGKASRTKASSILADQLQSSNTAEQADTGTVATTSIVAGCTLTSAFSPTTGQPCSSTTQPTTPNLPAGCTSTYGFSITTGQACNGIATTVQQIQQTVQQIAQNTTPIDACPNISGNQSSIPSGMILQNGNCITPTTTPETDYPGAPAPTDMCPNIAGVQTTIPTGMIRSSQTGNCTTPPPAGFSASNFSGTTTGSPDKALLTLTFDITASGGDFYIPKTGGLNYSTIDGTGSVYSTITTDYAGLYSHGFSSGNYYTVSDGETVTFNATFALSSPANSGMYGIRLNTLSYDTDTTVGGELNYTFPVGFDRYGFVPKP